MTQLLEQRPQDAKDLPSPTCPLCHTVDHTITSEALASGGSWTCARCGQGWDAARLATVAAYERYQVTTRS